MSFRLKVYRPDVQHIEWEVPYFPQKDMNSCWYFAMKMILEAYEAGRMKRIKGELSDKIRQLISYWQVDKLPNFGPDADAIQDMRQRFGFVDFTISGADGSPVSLHALTARVYEALCQHGPLINETGGHVYPIVGVNVSEGVLIVHYTLPLVFKLDDDGTLLKNTRFWDGTGKNPKASIERNRSLMHKFGKEIKDWIQSKNYGPLAHGTGKELDYKAADLADTIRTSITVTEDEIIAACGDVKLLPMLKVPIKAQIVNFKVASRMFGPKALKMAQYMRIPIIDFLHYVGPFQTLFKNPLKLSHLRTDVGPVLDFALRAA